MDIVLKKNRLYIRSMQGRTPSFPFVWECSLLSVQQINRFLIFDSVEKFI